MSIYYAHQEWSLLFFSDVGSWQRVRKPGLAVSSRNYIKPTVCHSAAKKK